MLDNGLVNCAGYWLTVFTWSYRSRTQQSETVTRR